MVTEIQEKQSARSALLVFARRDDLFAQLAERLDDVAGDNGMAPVLVKPGVRFRRLGERIYQINPAQQGDYRELLAQVGDSFESLWGAVHLWNYECSNVDYVAKQSLHSLNSTLAGSFELGYSSVEHLRCAVEATDREAGIKLLYLHHGAREALQPQNVMVAGTPETFAPLQVRNVHIDDRLASLADASKILAEELRRGDGGSVRYSDRGGLERETIYDASPGDEVTLRANGVYLIANDSHGRGQRLAERLLEAHGCRILLVEGKASDSASEPQRASDHDGKIVRVGSLDDVAALRASVRDKVKDELRRLDGVIHYLDTEASLQDGIAASLALDDITADIALEFFAWIVPGGADVPANQASRAMALRNLAIGQAALRADLVVLGRRAGASRWFSEELAFSAVASEHGATAQDASPDIDFDGEEVKQEVRRLLAEDLVELVSDTLSVPATDIDLDLSIDLDSADSVHFDSISLTQLAARIGELFDITLSPVVFFKYKRLSALVEHLHSKHYARLADHYKLTLVAGRRTLTLGHAAAAGPREPAVPVPADTAPADSGSWQWLGESDRVDQEMRPDDIAIIGAAGRFPGAEDLVDYWKNLVAGKDVITEIPPERWDWRQCSGDTPQEADQTAIKWGGFISGIDEFDPGFFGLSEKEARIMAPSHRLFLEMTWKLIEDAGYRATELAASKTGVFVGAGVSEYHELYSAHGNPVEEQSSTGRSNSILANRISFFLDLRGPSEAVDAACASSLVAMRRAMASIRSGECTMAIAGGVHFMLSPSMHISFSRGGVLAPDGRCRAFDRAGAGYVRSEGIGAVLLKPLHQAIADGDNIYAVVRASAINHGGRSNSMTSPNPNAQEELLRSIYAQQGVDPRSVQYIEAHGTGTLFGDSIELSSLSSIFTGSGDQDRRKSCGVGSVKSNIGHSEEAAGMASVLKVILSMRHGVIPANLHFSALNPHIDLDGTPLYIVDRNQPWAAASPGHNRRRAGVSAFGFGGVNAHIVVEEAPLAPTSSRHEGPFIVPLSAERAETLSIYAGALLRFLGEEVSDGLALSDIAYTLQVGREPMAHRLAIVAADRAELSLALTGFLSGGSLPANVMVAQVAGDGPAGNAEVAQAITERDHARIAALWVAGGTLAWRSLYRDSLPRRVSLPTYPFYKQRYWFDQGSRSGQSASGMGGADRAKLLAEWNDTEVEYPRDTCFPALFHERALQHRDQTAVISAGVALTYGELDERSSLIAADLQERGCGVGSYVGIFFDRSVDMLAAVLGVMKVGATYIPLDPLFPADRLAFIVEETRLGHVLVNRAVDRHLVNFAGDVIHVDQGLYDAVRARGSHGHGAAEPALVRGPAPEDIAYVIYTSGSTGKPKGVQVPHRALTNFLSAMSRALDFSASTHLVAVTTICFDIAGLELFLPLLCGGKVEILVEDVCRDGLELKQAIDAADATVMQATPATWQMLISAGWQGKRGFTALCGGEALSRALADALLERVDGLWNLYGPTETTIWSTMTEVERGDEITIGRPIANTRVYVLDENLAQVPIGQPGELCIGGDGVAKGYLNRPELTRDKFIRNPFDDGAADTLYRTGDQVYYRPDGKLIYAGRIDNQVKLRGYRIELEEIEQVLQAMDGMSKVVVVVRADRMGQQALHAFYASSDGRPVADQQSARYLRQRLPEYMVPACFEHLASWPMTLNRKIDRKALVQLELDELAQRHGAGDVRAHEMPRAARAGDAASDGDTVEQILKDAAATVLQVGVDRIDPSKTFNECGFTSITLTALRSEILQRLGILVEPPQLFKYPSIAALSRHLVENSAVQLESQGSAMPSVAGPEPIAVVGMFGRFPQSQDLDAFFDGLVDGKDCISELPVDRWPHRRGEQNPERPTWGGFLSDCDKFDAPFFNISPREARLMDPRQRLLIEAVWKTFEDAGYQPAAFAGTRAGVFIGAINSDYWDVQRDLGVELEGYSLSGFANSILPNRISFLFDLLGPSEAIDTACSSSLIAVHRAVTSLRRMECSAAIAGGVNLILSPYLYEALSRNGMLSPDGRCKTFDRAADGYVRGEGVGTILLKRLSDARRDGDHIYAVIRGGAVNHGGRANSLTAPNPDAQVQLLLDAYADAGISPGTVSLVETHGTGTKLGDPIEVESLLGAFGQATEAGARPVQPQHYCALGAVKTHIGHLEAAAGIAGLIKVILAMVAEKIPGNLHFKEQNPLIDLQGSPFVIADKTRDWEPIAAGIPRRAGVSSFGFGGANAHLVLEEHREDARPKNADRVDAVIALSARSEDRLQEYARALLEFVEKGEQGHPLHRDIRLADIAYTLHMGRMDMDHRLAFVVRGLDEVADKLREFLNGRVPAHGDGRGDELERLARQWAAGDDVDWGSLYQGTPRPRRVSLPTYPFARQTHWVSAAPSAQRSQSAPAPRALAPLVDGNESTLERVVFRKQFRVDAGYIRDHRIAGRMLLPAVVYLEMIRMAGELAGGGTPVRRIRNVVWPKALDINDARDVFIYFERKADAVGFSVVTRNEDGSEDVHAQGSLEYSGAGAGGVQTQTVDVAAIERRCTASRDAAAFYRPFVRLGYDYGASLKPIRALHHNDREAVAEIVLPESAERDDGTYLLHPSMMEGMLQTLAGLLFSPDGEDSAAFLPFSIEELEIHGAVPARCHAYVTVADPPGAATVNARFDLALIDSTGRVVVTLRGYRVRPAKPVAARSDNRPLLYRAVLKRSELRSDAQPADRDDRRPLLIVTDHPGEADRLRQALGAQDAQQAIIWVKPGKRFRSIAGGFEIDARKQQDYDRLVAELRDQGQLPGTVVHCCASGTFTGESEAMRVQMNGGALGIVRLVKAVLREQLDSSLSLLYLYENSEDGGQPLSAAVKGLARSLRMETERVRIKVVETDDLGALPQVAASELSMPAQADDFVVYRDGTRHVETLEEISLTPGQTLKPIVRDGGVYLLVGGHGGLGRVLARHFAERARVRLVLCGRSEMSAEQRRELEAAGAEVEFIQADVSSYDQVLLLRQRLRSRYGSVHGIVHCAGTLRDQVLAKKTVEDFEAVLDAKVFGAAHLDRAFADEKLDFFVVYSSMVGLTGNVGQTDYAFANSFLDGFMRYRAALCDAGQRHGSCHAIAWPYWQSGGMRVAQQTEKFIKDFFGVEPLTTSVGLRAFDEIVSCGIEQALVLDQASARTARVLGVGEASATSAATESNAGSIELDSLTEEMRRIVAEILHMRADEIDLDKDLADYGYDSITFTELASTINQELGCELTPAVFFELTPASLRSLIAHLAKTTGAKPRLTNTRPAEAAPVVQASAAQVAPRSRLPVSSGSGSDTTAETDLIAIIGMSGRMPRSSSLEEFWRSLAERTELVSEVPDERWAWADYFGDPRKESNKSVSRWGSFVDDVDAFDAAFFDISPDEARLLDPQQRLYLETVWGALEDAGYDPAALAGSQTGLFVGVTNHDYADVVEGATDRVQVAATFGNAHAFLVNRISYLLDFHGPSEPVDTLCSSSLVAIHKAVEDLKRGMCNLAIAGGVSVIASPRMDIAFSEAGMLSPSGSCRSFARGADGFVRGEGCGAIVLKPLAAAKRDGDFIYGVVRATGVGHGGRGNALTAPNGTAQAQLIKKTYDRAGIDPRTIGMLEAHGTGTEIGDAVELNSMKRAFQELTVERDGVLPTQPYCAVSCVKTNIGHLESAAGIAGVMKVLLALHHETIPGLAHRMERNPYIEFDQSPFYLAETTQPWEEPVSADGVRLPRRAGVNSFGAGGTNAHVVIEEHLAKDGGSEASVERVQVVPLSAKDEAALQRYAVALRNYLGSPARTADGMTLEQVAYTLQSGRSPMPCRLAIVAGSLAELEALLAGFCAGQRSEGIHHGTAAGTQDAPPVRLDGRVDVGDLNRVASAWCRGGVVDWLALYRGKTPGRVPVPTYPFARTRYWVGAESNGESTFDESHYRELLEKLWQGEADAATILGVEDAARSVEERS